MSMFWKICIVCCWSLLACNGIIQSLWNVQQREQISILLGKQANQSVLLEIQQMTIDVMLKNQIHLLDRPYRIPSPPPDALPWVPRDSAQADTTIRRMMSTCY